MKHEVFGTVLHLVQPNKTKRHREEVLHIVDRSILDRMNCQWCESATMLPLKRDGPSRSGNNLLSSNQSVLLFYLADDGAGLTVCRTNGQTPHQIIFSISWSFQWQKHDRGAHLEYGGDGNHNFCAWTQEIALCEQYSVHCDHSVVTCSNCKTIPNHHHLTTFWSK